MKRAVEGARLQQEPYLVWNAFIDLLAMEEYDNLNSLQRKAHLVFWYDSEVQNGGHGQYFDNRGVNRLDETVAALKDLGLACQAQVLSRAIVACSATEPGTDWVDTLHDSFINELDDAFHRSAPPKVLGTPLGPRKSGACCRSCLGRNRRTILRPARVRSNKPMNLPVAFGARRLSAGR